MTGQRLSQISTLWSAVVRAHGGAVSIGNYSAILENGVVIGTPEGIIAACLRLSYCGLAEAKNRLDRESASTGHKLLTVFTG